MSYLLEEELDTNGHYVFCHFPHGVYPMGPILAATFVDKMFPGMKVFGISADNVFRVPFHRHFMSWIGAKPANQENFKNLLSLGSCGVVVGGLAEMYLNYDNNEEIVLKSRKGFIRVAVETGSSLVPIYYFGNSQLLKMGPKMFQSISRKLRFSFGLIYGRFFAPIPYQVPLFAVVGKALPAIKVSRDDPNFNSVVDKLHEEFSQALVKLFDDHKETYGWKNRKLIVT